MEYPIDIGTNEVPITRADLARQIAYHFFGFFIVGVHVLPLINFVDTLLISNAITVISLRGHICSGKSEGEMGIRFIRSTSQHSGISKAPLGGPPSEFWKMSSACCTCQLVLPVHSVYPPCV